MTARIRKEKTFEEAMERLEAIVAAIESDDLGWRSSSSCFRRAWPWRATATGG